MDKDKSNTDCSIHLGPVQDLSYSKVCETGYYLASGCQQGVAMIRQGVTGQWMGTFEGHEACIWSVCLNADATRLVTGSDDKTVRLWNAYDGSLIKKYCQSKPVSCVAIDSKSKNFLTGNLEADPIISLYDMEAERPVIEFKGHTRGVRNVCFCRNDSSFVSSSYDRSVRLWDCRSGVQSHSIIVPHHAKSLELCADGQTLTICYGESIVFLDVDRFEVLEHQKMSLKMVCASLHPEKATFVSCGSDHCVYKYDYATGFLLDRFQAHEGNIRTIKYSPDGKMYATCANRGDVAIWPQNSATHTVLDESPGDESYESHDLDYDEDEIYGQGGSFDDQYSEDVDDENWPVELFGSVSENVDAGDSSEQFDPEEHDDEECDEEESEEEEVDSEDEGNNDEENNVEEDNEELDVNWIPEDIFVDANSSSNYDLEEYDDENSELNEDYNNEDDSLNWDSDRDESLAPFQDSVPSWDESLDNEEGTFNQPSLMEFEDEEFDETEFDESMYDHEYDY